MQKNCKHAPTDTESTMLQLATNSLAVFSGLFVWCLWFKTRKFLLLTERTLFAVASKLIAVSQFAEVFMLSANSLRMVREQFANSGVNAGKESVLAGFKAYVDSIEDVAL